jgi:epoxide hydrolase-like predicted phosphatase
VIKTVIFDLGNVIVPFDFRLGYQEMAMFAGIDPDEIPVRIRQTDLVPRYEAGEIPTPDFIDQLGRQVGFKATEEQFAAMWSRIFLKPTLIPETLPQRIREAGFRLLLLSNTNDLHFRFIRPNYPILQYFDDLVLSYEVGATKPSPRIYQEAIRRAGCLPEECFFTDDIPEYVEGARRAGIDAVRFESHDQIVRELEQRNVLR